MALYRQMTHNIPLHIYDHDVLVSIGDTNAQLQKAVMKYTNPDILDDLKNDNSIFHFKKKEKGLTVHYQESGVTIIRLMNRPKTPQQYGSLNHEIFHAVDFIFRRIGLSLTEESSEAYAYAIGHLTEQIFEKFKLK